MNIIKPAVINEIVRYVSTLAPMVKSRCRALSMNGIKYVKTLTGKITLEES